MNKEQERKYHRKYYSRMSDEKKERKVSLQRKRRHKLSENLKVWLKEHPCVDCGERDVVVLELDHTKGEKFKSVSDMVRGGYSWDKILNELEKCEVRCANCHRRKTAKQFDWQFK